MDEIIIFKQSRRPNCITSNRAVSADMSAAALILCRLSYPSICLIYTRHFNFTNLFICESPSLCLNNENLGSLSRYPYINNGPIHFIVEIIIIINFTWLPNLYIFLHAMK